MVVFPSGISSEHVLAPAPFLPPVDGRIGRALPSLVLTGHPLLRERLRLITEARGCVCHAPATAAAAWRALAGGPGLVFIDIAYPLDGRLEEAQAIAEVLASRAGAMLVICGTAPVSAVDGLSGDAERWARELGAFVYLPGVGTNAGVALIVDEASRLFGGKR